jgi:hypothetical protein
LEFREALAATRLVAMEGQAERVDKLWDWKQFFSGKWAVLVVIGATVIPIALKFLLDLLLKWLKP